RLATHSPSDIKKLASELGIAGLNSKPKILEHLKSRVLSMQESRLNTNFRKENTADAPSAAESTRTGEAGQTSPAAEKPSKSAPDIRVKASAAAVEKIVAKIEKTKQKIQALTLEVLGLSKL